MATKTAQIESTRKRLICFRFAGGLNDMCSPHNVLPLAASGVQPERSRLPDDLCLAKTTYRIADEDRVGCAQIFEREDALFRVGEGLEKVASINSRQKTALQWLSTIRAIVCDEGVADSS